MKILVTGGTGNVGRTVIAGLAERGANVRVLARKQPEEGKLPDGVEVAIGDPALLHCRQGSSRRYRRLSSATILSTDRTLR
jgi:nucleoside-diphosphate-sugar epimerase